MIKSSLSPLRLQVSKLPFQKKTRPDKKRSASPLKDIRFEGPGAHLIAKKKQKTREPILSHLTSGQRLDARNGAKRN